MIHFDNYLNYEGILLYHCYDVVLFRYSVPSYLLKNISDLGYNEPTPVQMQTIPLLLHVSALFIV